MMYDKEESNMNTNVVYDINGGVLYRVPAKRSIRSTFGLGQNLGETGSKG